MALGRVRQKVLPGNATLRFGDDTYWIQVDFFIYVFF